MVQPQLIATGDPQFGQHLLVMGEHLQTAVHDLAKIHIGVQQALRVLDVVITRVGKGGIGLCQPEIAHIEQLILVVDLAGEPEPRVHQKAAAVQLVAHDVEIEGGGLFHVLLHKLLLAVVPGGQKAVNVHLRLGGVGLYAQLRQ